MLNRVACVKSVCNVCVVVQELKRHNVKDVVRVCEPSYSTGRLDQEGITVVVSIICLILTAFHCAAVVIGRITGHARPSLSLSDCLFVPYSKSKKRTKPTSM